MNLSNEPVPAAPDGREMAPAKLSHYDIKVVVDLPHSDRVIAACMCKNGQLNVDACTGEKCREGCRGTQRRTGMATLESSEEMMCVQLSPVLNQAH